MTHSGKALLLSLLLAGLLPLPSQTRKPGASGNRDPDAVRAISKLEDEWRFASLKNTGSWWADYLTESYVDTDPQGKVRGKAESVEMHKSADMVLDTVNLSDRNVQTFNGDTVIVTGKMTLAGTYSGQSVSGDYQFTRVWVKLGLEWKLAASHTSKLSP